MATSISSAPRIYIDATQAATDTIQYVATDSAGLAATSTRARVFAADSEHQNHNSTVIVRLTQVPGFAMDNCRLNQLKRIRMTDNPTVVITDFGGFRAIRCLAPV